MSTVDVRSYPTRVTIAVKGTQGRPGDVTPELIALKEQAEQAAGGASEAALQAGQAAGEANSAATTAANARADAVAAKQAAEMHANDAAVYAQSAADSAASVPSNAAERLSALEAPGYGTPLNRPDFKMGYDLIVTHGASITNGSSASNAGTLSYSALLGRKLPGNVYDQSVVYMGYPGQRPSFLADDTRIAATIDRRPDYVILGPDFGTNGAADSTLSGGNVFDNYGQWVLKAVRDFTAAGIRVSVCMTLPQGSQATAEAHNGIAIRNAWLVLVGEKYGIDIIDTYSPLIDNATGYLRAAYYASGADPVHPNDAGHLALSDAIAAHIRGLAPDRAWPVCMGLSGLVPNSLSIGATNNGWSQIVAPSTFSGATHAIDPPLSREDLPLGQWHRVNCDATATGGVLRTGTPSFAVTPGETLLIVGYAKSSGTGTAQVNIWNMNTTANAATLMTLVNGAPSVPFSFRYVVPNGMTSMRLILSMTTAVGNNLSASLGAYDVFRPVNYQSE